MLWWKILPIVLLHSHDETLYYMIILTKSNIFQVLKDFFIVPEGVLLMSVHFFGQKSRIYGFHRPWLSINKDNHVEDLVNRIWLSSYIIQLLMKERGIIWLTMKTNVVTQSVHVLWSSPQYPYQYFNGKNSCGYLFLPPVIDENYRVITLILKNMVNNPSVWRIMHYSRYPQFSQIFYIHIH